jgi:hypothetical protein
MLVALHLGTFSLNIMARPARCAFGAQPLAQRASLQVAVNSLHCRGESFEKWVPPVRTERPLADVPQSRFDFL